MWSEKWYLKRNISCDADLLNELLETDVPWDDAIVVSAGKLRKLWDSLSELRSSVCERRLENQFWGLRYCLQNCAVYSVFPSGMTLHSKVAQFNWQYIGPLTCSAFFFPIREGKHSEWMFTFRPYSVRSFTIFYMMWYIYMIWYVLYDIWCMIWYVIYYIWYDMTYDVIRYIWYMILYDMKYDVIYYIWYDMIWYMM